MSDKTNDDKIYTFANVIFKCTDECTYCYISDFEIHAGDFAEVITDEGAKYTLVAYIDRTTADKAPYPFEKLKSVKSRVPKGSPQYEDLFKKFLRNSPSSREEESHRQIGYDPYDEWSDGEF